MQTLRLEYGDGHVEVQLPDSAVVVRSDPHREPPALADPVAATRSAIRHPLGSPSLRELVGPGARVALAFPDRVKGGIHETAHRRLTIPAVLDELESAGVAPRDVTFVCAVGLHRKNRLEEFRDYLGAEIVDRMGPERIVNHDAEDPNGIVKLPDSELGDVVELNRSVAEADLAILIGHTTGNPYGGFSGGYKMPATGLTTWRSIRCHHTPSSMSRSDFAAVSPVSHFRRQLTAVGSRMEAAMGRAFFSVDAVLNSRSEQIAVFAGTIPAVEEASWPIATQRTHLAIPGEPADVLVLGMPRNFHYGMGMGSNPILMMQAIGSSLTRAKRALKPYPVVIAASVCDGWFNLTDFPSYEHAYRLLQTCSRASDMSVYEDEFCTNQDYIYQYRFAHAFHPFHAFSMIYMGGLAPELSSAVYIAGAKQPGYARGMGAIPADSVEAALRDAERHVGHDPKVLVVPELSKIGYHLSVEERS